MYTYVTFGDRRERDDQNATSVGPLLSLGLLLWFPNLILLPMYIVKKRRNRPPDPRMKLS